MTVNLTPKDIQLIVESLRSEYANRDGMPAEEKAHEDCHENRQQSLMDLADTLAMDLDHYLNEPYAEAEGFDPFEVPF
jgi:hypothetical protein